MPGSNRTYLVVNFNKFRIISSLMTTLQTLSAKSSSVPTQNTGIISAIYQHFPEIINVYFGALTFNVNDYLLQEIYVFEFRLRSTFEE
jgi:hypothetical protein